MAVEPSVLEALRAAVAADPSDAALRAHLAQLLLDDAQMEDALGEARIVLAAVPDHVAALRVAAEAAERSGLPDVAASYRRLVDAVTGSASDEAGTGGTPSVPTGSHRLASTVPDTPESLFDEWSESDAPEEPTVGELGRPALVLADVAGMDDVKQRLEQSFLGPLRRPDLSLAFGKSLRGGLLMWGPPGCGKTYVARAVAGELDAAFYEVGLADVLDMWVGSSERNIHSIFEVARRNRPCVLFFDEIDALGHKRTLLRGGGGAMRGVVNQLLAELDGVSSDNEGVFALAATNHPWDVDPALVRPGRFDRRLLVLPPDRSARVAVLDHHLRGRPVGRVDLDKLAGKAAGYTGADLALVCEQAAETAMAESMRRGAVVPIDQRMLAAALGDVTPSIGDWLETARNYAVYNNEDGTYDDLLGYLARRR